MITALNTCKLIKTRSAKQGQEGRWGWESSCVACNFFLVLFACSFFQGFPLACILQPLPGVRKFFRVEFTWIDFFPVPRLR